MLWPMPADAVTNDLTNGVASAYSGATNAGNELGAHLVETVMGYGCGCSLWLWPRLWMAAKHAEGQLG